MPTRPFFLVTGWVFVGLAAVGVVVPLLPTTPFLIVAAACFARSSERFHRWLLDSRVFGPLLRSWQETRSIPPRAKLVSVALIAAVGGCTAIFVLDTTWSRVLLLATLAAVALWLLTRPSLREPASPAP